MKELAKLEKLSACSNAVEYVKTKKNFASAWADCERGDWMLWLIGKKSGKPDSKERRKLVLVACDCAELSLQYVTKGENRPAEAIRLARASANGEKVTLEQVETAANAANAAYAAANAAYAANAAAYAAAKKKEILKQTAEIVRKYYPKAVKF